MKISGSNVIDQPVEKVWDALLDPRVLVATIPGCERLETTGDHQYAMTVTAGVAAIKGTYNGSCALSDLAEHRSLVMRLSGAGAPGTVDATVNVAFSEPAPGQTQIAYDADAVVGGMIGGVGQRLLTTVAKRTAGEFFGAVEEVLTSGGVEATEGEAAALLPGDDEAGAAARAGAGGAGPRVYSAPARPRAAFPGGDFAAGVAFGAAAALLGALVGGYLARRASRDH
jgi:carbon monoxide dehydrogenase subunit G